MREERKSTPVPLGIIASFQAALAANLNGQTSVVENNLYKTLPINAENGVVSLNPYYASAVASVKSQYGLDGESALNAIFGWTGPTADFGITQLYGLGAHNDSIHVANDPHYGIQLERRIAA